MCVSFTPVTICEHPNSSRRIEASRRLILDGDDLEVRAAMYFVEFSSAGDYDLAEAT